MEQHEPLNASLAATTSTKEGVPVRESTPLRALPTNQQQSSRFDTSRQKISGFRFYLDSMDEQLEKRIKNRLKLLGSSIEAFFSNKCTHLITTKPYTEQALGGNKPDPIVAKALQWKLKIMAPDKLSRALQQIVDGHTSGHRSNRQQQQQAAAAAAAAAAAVGGITTTTNGPPNLAALMEHEKRYGVGTSRGGVTERPTPQFIPFKHRYLLVEDATQVHRPLVIKEYMAVNDICFWPYLKNTPAHKSPFAQMPGVSSEKMAEQKRQQQHQQQQQQQQQAAPTPAPTPAAPAPAAGPNTPVHSSNFKPSGIQPSMTTNPVTMNMISNTIPTAMTPTTTTNITMPTSRLSKPGVERPPSDEKVARLDRRMVDSTAPRLRTTAALNSTNKKQVKDSTTKMQDEAARLQAYYAKKKVEQEMQWCEICNKRYQDFKQHVQEKGHQAYIKDKNNFNVLDTILMTVRRKYKSPLPMYMKNTIDPDIDGCDVQFEGSSNSIAKSNIGTKRPIEYMDIDEEPPEKRPAPPTLFAHK